jgi:Ca2+-transporting ATPase
MTARVVFAGDREIDVTGEGYDDQGELQEVGARLEDLPDPVLRTVAVGAIANTASIHKKPEGELKVSGDPTEAALVALASKVRVARHSMLARSEEALTIPFSSARKRMTVVTRELRPDGTYTVHCKGAADVLLHLCAEERTEAGVVPLTDARRAELLERVARYSARALRVLAMAEREGGPELNDRDEAERSLVFLGLVGMIDPPRREVRGAIAECHRAGIRVVMITGDHPGTARSIAEDLGLWEEGALTLTGEELRGLSDEALAERLPRVRVFARVEPEHKLRIVQALQARGEVAAMTGDGVNDAPAIKQAAIGVAMGKSGTDVAREAADMVLADDNFATIVEAVREGRAIYRNIQKSIFFLLSSNAGLCLAVFVTGFLPPDRAPPLTALQILWINLVTNGLPALALGVDPPEEGQMREAPRPSGAPILGTMDYLGMLGVGVLMCVCAVAVYFLPVWGPEPHDHEARTSKLTMVFTLLALSPLAHAFNCRSRRASIFKLGWLSNPYLLVAVVVSGAIHGLSLAIPGLQPVFHTDHDWTWPEFGVVVALSLLPIPLVELAKVLLPAPPKGKQG